MVVTEDVPNTSHRRTSHVRIKRHRYFQEPRQIGGGFIFAEHNLARGVHFAEIGAINMSKPMTFDDTTAASKWVYTGIVFWMLIGVGFIAFVNWG